jgi:hypothetical protein
MDPVVGWGADGRLEVFVVGDDSQLYHATQIAPNDGWSGWHRMGPVWASWHSDPALVQNADGQLELFLRGDDAQLYQAWR